MCNEAVCDENLMRRLPLPIAQLYRRAHNAKSSLERHQAACYLWEASLKLLASVAIAESWHAGFKMQAGELLKDLVRPSLGHWWSFVRGLVPLLAGSGDRPFQEVCSFLDSSRDDLPRAAGLDALLLEALPLGGGERSTVRPGELFDRLAAYCDGELEHGADRQRSLEFYDRMGETLLSGVGEILLGLDPLAGRCLLHVDDVRRQESGDWLVERYHLIGESSRRIESQVIPGPEAVRLPRPHRLYLSLSTDSQAKLLSIHPLLLHDHETGEVFFLNAYRERKRGDYLCYMSGRVLAGQEVKNGDQDLLGSLRGLLGEVQTEEERGGEAEKAPRGGGSGSPPSRERIGDYEILSTIGRGGMGVVYRAWQPSLRRQVALKRLLRPGDPKAEERFSREIRSLARVDHPHLVKIFTSGSEGDHWYYTMEILEGADLARVCERLSGKSAAEITEEEWQRAVSAAWEDARNREQSLSPAARPSRFPGPAPAVRRLQRAAARAGQGHVAQVVEIVRQVAEACHALHLAGVIHRDIKPGNILLTTDGSQAVLLDLGLAQLADETQGRLTRTHHFVGTLRYASPEQIQAVQPLDRRSDVYSLGATLWELLTLRPLFGDSDECPTPELLMFRIHSADPESPRRSNPRIPADLEAVVLKCLEKDPDRRYSSAQRLASDLERWQNGQPVIAQQPTLGYLLGKHVRRHRLRISATIAVLLALLIAGGVEFYRVKRAALENQRLLARQYVARGVRILDEGDPLGSLPWLGAALNLDWGDPVREEMDRMRLGAVLGNSPRLLQIWTHQAGVRKAEFSPDGLRVVTSSYDFSARVWNVATGEPVTPPLQHLDQVNIASFSPDGSRVVTASNDGTARVWDSSTGKALTPALQHSALVRHASFSPDGRRIATASRDQTARVWDAATGEPVTPPLQHAELVGQVTFSPDGRYLLTASNDFTARIWDAATGQPVTPPLQHSHWVRHASFSHDGRLAVTASRDGTARVWDAATGLPVTPPLKHGDWLNEARFSPDGRQLATACRDGSARIWDAASGLPLTPPLLHSRAVRHVEYSSDGRRLLTASEDHTARLWDPLIGTALVSLKHGDELEYASFSPEGRRIITTSRDGTTRLWLLPLSPRWVPLEPTGKAMAGVREGRVLLRKPGTGESVTMLAAAGDRVIQVSLSPDGALLVTASRDRTARIWDAASGQPVTPPLQHRGVVNYAEFSFDGRRLVTASDDQTARVWDASSGEAVTGPLEHTGEVNQASFSRDGRRLVTASRDRTARVWDASTGRPLSPPLKHNDSVQWAAFSPNGRWVATASDDGAARVWTVEKWEPVSQPMNHRRGVVHVSFSPDAHRIVTTCTDGSVRVWNADMGEPVTLALQVDGLRAEFTAGGRQVTIAGPLFSSYLWELPWDGRPAGDLALLADALSAQRVDASGGAVAIETRAVFAAWERLRTRYPEDFASSAEGDEAWHRREVEACELSSQWAGAIPHLEHLLSARPSDRELHLRRARAYAEQGLWALAGDEYDWCLNHGETGVAAWRSRALVRLAAGDDLGYRDTLKHLLSRFGTADDPQTAAALAWICVTVPGSVPEVEQVVLLAERTEARGITGQRGRSALGAALLRKGEYAGAIQQIQRVIDPQTGGGGTAWDWLFLSMAHQGLGGSIEAATWLRKADRWIDQQVQGVPEAGEARGFGLSWEERLELGLLRREAESRLQPGRS